MSTHTTTTQEESATQLVDAFEMFDGWEERYPFLIDLGRKLPPLDAHEKVEANRVHGCQSNVWLVAQSKPAASGEEVIEFVADSDSSIVKGLIAILRRIYSGRTAREILSFDTEAFLARLGLDSHLSISRRNGLNGMVARIKSLAAQNTAEAQQ